MAWPKSSFWDYSLSLYGQSDVEQACLALQDRHDLNVNLLLFACWLADQGIELDQDVLARADAAISTWHGDIVLPLRALRRRLAAEMAGSEQGKLIDRWQEQVEMLRQKILALELDGEHLTQLALTDIGSDLEASRPAGMDLAARNLAQYWSFQADDLNDLKVLLSQAFPDSADVEQLENTLIRPAL